jgi:hypothetical protein
MAVFAGEVFPEWYWGPIFFMVVFSPVLVAAAVGTDVVVRRLHGPLPLWKRSRLWIAAATVATGAILAFMAVRDHLRFEGESREAAASIRFTVHRPAELPAGLHETRVEAHDGRLPYLVSHYENRSGPPTRAYAFEQEPTEVSLRPGACTVSDIEGISSNFFDGPCKALRTASGRAVFTGPSEGTVDGRDAFALLDGTLVRLISVGLSERDVLAWFDSLRPVDVEDIDFKG